MKDLYTNIPLEMDATRVITPIHMPILEPVKIENFSDDDIIYDKISHIEETKHCEFTEPLVSLVENFDFKRDIDSLFVHCTGTNQDASVSAIEKYWKDVKGWGNTKGYHVIFKPDGTWTYLQDFNISSYGASGHNRRSINISYIGGVDSSMEALDNRTDKQKEMMILFYECLKDSIKDIKLRGHNEVTNKKACPSFDVQKDFYS